jgi:hypothetical protein
MNRNFEYITNLEYKAKGLTAKVALFESGEKYIAMRSEFHKQLKALRRIIKKLEKKDTILIHENNRTCKLWREANEEIYNEQLEMKKNKDEEIAKRDKKTFELLGIIDQLKAELCDEKTAHYSTRIELEEEQLKNSQLKAQINRDHSNSSIPSSMVINKKKIINNREKTDRKPGGQIGHKGHRRKKLTPTTTVTIGPPDDIQNNSNYKETGKIITKQLIELTIGVNVIEYSTLEFRNKKTGVRIHSEFPEDIVNEVNYGSSVKAFAHLMNNYCNVSIDKVSIFLSELTSGELQISKGMISGLGKEFSKKTEDERKEIFLDLLSAPVMNTDFTNGRLNGKQVQVNISAVPGKAIYSARYHKGNKGVEGTPVEGYHGILVHDHDRTFYNYGDNHQECLVHVLRYLKDSMDNESNLTWNLKMRELIQRMIHSRKNIDDGESLKANEVNEFKKEYSEILAIAQNEYDYEPPTNYYRNGYNLYKRLEKFMENHLLFLDDIRVPTDNNLSERLARVFKRKQKQVMTFRSMDSINHLCNSLSMLYLWCSQDENLFENMKEIFSKNPVLGQS